jgi:ADP-ribosyl-[dinitrogen reductase] hydrolase
MPSSKSVRDQFEACLIGGAIGDAWGSSYENESQEVDPNTFYWNTKKRPVRHWHLTDDTQLTMATCEALSSDPVFNADQLASCFVRYYRRGLSGAGGSTLKAMQELEAGAHWTQTGRSGEFAAGNGAAMRIAPFAFFNYITREDIRNACRITHRNDEAYVGALAIHLSIKAVLNKAWTGDNNLFDLLIPELPDTRIRDRLIEIDALKEKLSIEEVAKWGNNGYIVNSVPFAIFAATQVNKEGLSNVYKAVIAAGGDTDTNASRAGQIAATLTGLQNIPPDLMHQLEEVNGYSQLKEVIQSTQKVLEP